MVGELSIGSKIDEFPVPGIALKAVMKFKNASRH
jgi:hypothetical protein